MAVDMLVTRPNDEPGNALRAFEGQRLGRYLLHRALAHGGMGAVFLGQLVGSHGFEKWVAIKIIRPEVKDGASVDRFLHEAQLAAGINHPNVCAVLDFGEHDGIPYLVMEYLHGESLATIVNPNEVDARGQPPPWLTIRAVADAARGLHAAHDLAGADGKLVGLVHRDISPVNIQVLYDGIAKVVDFGVAYARGGPRDEEPSSLVGKMGYLSPEQALLEPLDRRSDVWSLGVTLWETTLLRRLFSGAGIEPVLKVLDMPIPRPREIDPRYPKDLEELVMACLSREPAGRPPTAALVADALDAHLHRAQERAGPTQVAGWLERHFTHRMKRKAAVLRGRPERPYETLPELDMRELVTAMTTLLPEARVRPHRRIIQEPRVYEAETRILHKPGARSAAYLASDNPPPGAAHRRLGAKASEAGASEARMARALAPTAPSLVHEIVVAVQSCANACCLAARAFGSSLHDRLSPGWRDVTFWSSALGMVLVAAVAAVLFVVKFIPEDRPSASETQLLSATENAPSFASEPAEPHRSNATETAASRR